jgi:hypothetical protein
MNTWVFKPAHAGDTPVLLRNTPEPRYAINYSYGNGSGYGYGGGRWGSGFGDGVIYGDGTGGGDSPMGRPYELRKEDEAWVKERVP